MSVSVLVFGRYGVLLAQREIEGSDREQTVALLDMLNAEEGHYQLGLTKVLTRDAEWKTVHLYLDIHVCCLWKVFLKELLYQLLEEKWSSTQTWAAITIQRNIRGFLCRRNFQFFRQKAIVIQSHIRGHQARYRGAERRLTQHTSQSVMCLFPFILTIFNGTLA